VKLTEQGWIPSLERSEASWVWWYTPVIPVLGRLRQDDCEFKASLSYIVWA
jgi:hypothetical protein